MIKMLQYKMYPAGELAVLRQLLFVKKLSITEQISESLEIVYQTKDVQGVPGPSCSKLTMSLVNDSLKFTSSDTQIC